MNEVIVKTKILSSIGAPEIEQDFLVGDDGRVSMSDEVSAVEIVPVRAESSYSLISGVTALPRLTLGQTVIAARAAKQLTQAQLADASGLNRSTILGIEADTLTPRGTTLQKICGVLDLNFSDLLQLGRPDDSAAASAVG